MLIFSPDLRYFNLSPYVHTVHVINLLSLLLMPSVTFTSSHVIILLWCKWPFGLFAFNELIDWLMSPGSKGIPGVWKARTGKKGVATMSWIRLKSLRCALPTSWEMEKSEWQCRYRPGESVTLLWRVLPASVKRGRAYSECYHIGPSSHTVDPARPNAPSMCACTSVCLSLWLK